MSWIILYNSFTDDSLNFFDAHLTRDSSTCSFRTLSSIVVIQSVNFAFPIFLTTSRRCTRSCQVIFEKISPVFWSAIISSFFNSEIGQGISSHDDEREAINIRSISSIWTRSS